MDRYYCTTPVMQAIRSRGASFVVRADERNIRCRTKGKRKSVGRSTTRKTCICLIQVIREIPWRPSIGCITFLRGDFCFFRQTAYNGRQGKGKSAVGQEAGVFVTRLVWGTAFLSGVLAATLTLAQQVPSRPYDGIQAGLDAYRLGEEKRRGGVNQQIFLNDQLRFWNGYPTSRGETPA